LPHSTQIANSSSSSIFEDMIKIQRNRINGLR
jgi:hypothetical protein